MGDIKRDLWVKGMMLCHKLIFLISLVLEYLAVVIRPIGIEAISQVVDEDQNTSENLVEPWLVRLRLMVKTSQGHQITELGLQHLGQEFQESRFLKA